MAKGYWIGRVDVHNEEGYKPYAAANPAIFKKFGARYVVRAGKFECVEGSSRSRNVVIEFPDYATALACYRSPEYQANIKVRQPHADRRPPRHRRLRRPAAVVNDAERQGERHAQRLLDSAHRCERPGRLQGLHGGDAAGA